MKNTPATFILGAILASGAGVSVAGAQELDELVRFRAENARLKIQNASLQESLVDANRRAHGDGSLRLMRKQRKL